MQIRELQLTELDIAYNIYNTYNAIEYKEFEDLIYEMRKENYHIFTIIDKGLNIGYAGIKIETNLQYKKHIRIYELLLNEETNEFKELLFYIKDYATIHMCKNIVLTCKEKSKVTVLQENGYTTIDCEFVKSLD